jgi:hypothetical protein
MYLPNPYFNGTYSLGTYLGLIKIRKPVLFCFNYKMAWHMANDTKTSPLKNAEICNSGSQNKGHGVAELNVFARSLSKSTQKEKKCDQTQMKTNGRKDKIYDQTQMTTNGHTEKKCDHTQMKTNGHKKEEI